MVRRDNQLRSNRNTTRRSSAKSSRNVALRSNRNNTPRTAATTRRSTTTRKNNGLVNTRSTVTKRGAVKTPERSTVRKRSTTYTRPSNNRSTVKRSTVTRSTRKVVKKPAQRTVKRNSYSIPARDKRVGLSRSNTTRNSESTRVASRSNHSNAKGRTTSRSSRRQ